MSNESVQTQQPGKTHSVLGGLYRYYVLAILMVAYLFSYMDRYIVSILLEDLKAEFSLNDLQLGLLSGLAFAFLYSTLAIPIARLADRKNRVRIVSIAIAVWSLFTAACGLAGNFWHLFLGRLGVGVGEAGGLAPSHSIIADYFEKSELSRALAVFSLGPTLGAVCGLLIGGAVADAYGWRAAFYAVGLPGLLLALLVIFTVREPQRGRLDPTYNHKAESLGIFDTLKTLWKNKTYVYANLAHATAIVTAYAMSSWLPSLFLRTFEISKSEAGAIVSAFVVIGGIPGTLLGGIIADALAKRDERWRAWSSMVGLLISIPFYSFALFSPNVMTMAVLFGVAQFFFHLSFVPALAIVQNVVSPSMRALAAAFVFFVANFIGLGLGPVVVGAVSDMFAADFGDASIKVALFFSLSFLLISAIFFWLTGIELRKTAGEETRQPAH